MFLRITLGNHNCKGKGSMTRHKLNCTVNGKLMSADPVRIFDAGMAFVILQSWHLRSGPWYLSTPNQSLDAGCPQEIGSLGQGKRQFPERDLAKNFQLPRWSASVLKGDLGGTVYHPFQPLAVGWICVGARKIFPSRELEWLWWSPAWNHLGQDFHYMIYNSITTLLPLWEIHTISF